MLPDSTPDSLSAGRRLRLAWAAVLCGGIMAGASLWYEGRVAALPSGAVAMVGNQPIARAQWLRAVQAAEGDRGFVLDAAGRKAILQRLIDEELLYQHALDSGLARDDPGLRKTLIAGLIDASTAGSGFDEDAARALFERDPGYFAAQPRLRVRAATTPADTAIATADVLKALRNNSVAAPLQVVELPDTPLTLAQLAQKLGGSAAAALHHAPVNELVGPLGQDQRQLYLLVMQRQADAPRYEDVAEAVRTESSRREADAALARLLDDLHRSTRIRIAEDAR